MRIRNLQQGRVHRGLVSIGTEPARRHKNTCRRAPSSAAVLIMRAMIFTQSAREAHKMASNPTGPMPCIRCLKPTEPNCYHWLPAMG
jgi:hypothetical protein